MPVLPSLLILHDVLTPLPGDVRVKAIASRRQCSVAASSAGAARGRLLAVGLVRRGRRLCRQRVAFVHKARERRLRTAATPDMLRLLQRGLGQLRWPPAAAAAADQRRRDASSPPPVPVAVQEKKLLVIGFQLPDNSIKRVTFTHRPLGLDFNKTNPIQMKRVQTGSQADQLGVKQGWKVHEVNGEVVSYKDFEYSYELLRKISAELP
mmetsp:Transcript_13288/g.34246  ORF Transcript_13288/g.34246 Transcript_13288/m.34246 type:complete len:208 (-) Transcript_13288:106-729(-)